MFIADALNYTLVIQDSDWANVLRVYDVQWMRYLHLRSPEVGTTFAWSSELKAAVPDIDTSKCQRLDVGKRSDTRFGVNNLSDQISERYAGLRNNTQHAIHSCAKTGSLDGSTGWTLEFSRCHAIPFCSGLYRAFTLHPSVQSEVD